MASLRTIPSRLPPVLRGILWMLLAALMFSGLNTTVRLASSEVPVLEVMFFRNFFNLVFMLPWLFQIGFGALRTERLGLHALRSGFGLTSMFLQFTALSLMPLAEATALSFSTPLFATIGVALIVGEKVRARRWCAIIVGFLGVLIMLQPWSVEVSVPAMMMLTGSMIVGGGFTCVKLLSRTESPNVMVLYMGLFMAPVSLIPALFVWVWPSPLGWFYLVCVGTCATLAHLCFNRAFAAADASAVLPFDYTRLLIVAFFGFVLFGEMPGFWTWIGAGTIVAANIYIAQREAARARTEMRAERSAKDAQTLASAAAADKLAP
jgi:drug/metabolite transporter (DMT)-like permease